MNITRTMVPVVFVAFLAACSGNLGGGQSTLPGAPTNGTNVQQIAPAAATPTPTSASNVATLGTAVVPQALPTINGWGGSIVFPQPSPSPSPNGKSAPAPATSVDPNANPVSVGITASTIEPADAPHFSSVAKHAKRSPYALTPLLFISLLATSDVTLGQYPKIAVDVPRDIASKHRDDSYALALYDPEQKDKSYHLGIADRDFSSPLPGTLPTAAPTPRPTPTQTPTPFGAPFGATGFTPPPIGQGLGSNSGGLPPEHVAFMGTAATLALKANRPVVFALYAIPPTPTPSPSPSPKGGASPSPSPAASGASPSPVPSASASTVPTSKPVEVQ